MPVRRDRSILEAARRERGLTQEAVARRAGTTQSTLSAYERGAKSPTLAVTERILASLGYELTLQEPVTFHEVRFHSGTGTAHVPDRLWRLEPAECFAPVTLPVSNERQTFDMSDHQRRAEAYTWLLLHGSEDLLFDHVDGALLVDHWAQIAGSLDPAIRRAWAPLIGRAITDIVDAYLIASLRAGRPKRRLPLGRRGRLALIERLAARGLDPDKIRTLLQRRMDAQPLRRPSSRNPWADRWR